MGEWKKNTEWCGSLSLIAGREGGNELAVNLFVSPQLFSPSLSLLCELDLPLQLLCRASSTPRCRPSPELLRLLNRWPVGSLTLINLTSIRPEVIGMPWRWLQGSSAAYESTCPLMNGSHHALQYVCVSDKGIALKHGSASKHGGMDSWLKDRGHYSFLTCYITWADLDGFILSICAHIPSLCPRLCSFSNLLLSFALEILSDSFLLFATYLSISGNKLLSLLFT